jgi:GntR family transcriptional regulator
MRYLDVQQQLATLIVDYTDHQRLPSERQLAVQYQCSRETIRKALENLHAEGKIFKHKHIGWLTSGQKIKYNLQSTLGFNGYTQAQGFVPHTKVISSHITPMDPQIAQHFSGLSPDHLCIEIIRLRHINQIPVLLEYNYLPYPEFADVLHHDLQHSLVAIIETHFQLHYSSSQLAIKHGSIDSFAQHVLMIPAHQSAIQIERINKFQDRVFEFDIEIWRNDKVEFGLEIFNAC